MLVNLPGCHAGLIFLTFFSATIRRELLLHQPLWNLASCIWVIGFVLSLILKEKHLDQRTLTLTLTHSHIQLPSYNLQDHFKAAVTRIHFLLEEKR